jgi:hypothetical protein
MRSYLFFILDDHEQRQINHGLDEFHGVEQSWKLILVESVKIRGPILP